MKTAAEWKATEQELMNLQKWREELKNEVTKVSRKIHILATSISQYRKKIGEVNQ